MKKKLTHNFWLKVLSLALAVLVWLVVLNIEDPVTTIVYSDIVVTEVNADQISEAGKSYTYSDGNTISVRVKGKTSIINKLTRDDLLAVADLSNLSITGAVAVDVSCPKYPSLEITAIGSSTVLHVDIEDIVEKSYNVKIVVNGSVPDGYYYGQGVAAPNMVTISGPESDVAQVSEAVVYVNLYNAVSDVTTNASLVLLDSDGNTLSLSTLTVSQTDIAVAVPVYVTKTVSVNFELTGEPAEGYQLISAIYEPQEITIAGKAEALKNITSITLTDYDITGFSESFEDTIIIADYLAEELPDGVVLTDKEEVIAIQAQIQAVEETEYDIALSRIALKGNQSGYTYIKSDPDEDSDDDSTITVFIQGLASELEELSGISYTATVDVSDCGVGIYDLPISITFNGNVELAEEALVHIVVSKSADE